MPRGRLSMRTIREVLRLKYDGRLTHREIARSCGIAASTVVNYLTRASQAGVSWPLVPELSEQDLEARLFHRPITDLTSRPRPLPDYAAVEEELRRHARLNLTLDLLWREYKEQHPDGYQYTQFVAHYHRWRQHRDVCLRQTHRYGEKLFVDYAGQTVPVHDQPTDERRPAQIFVAVWGASNYTYAEATWTQTLPDWIGAHVRAFTYFGGVPQIVVPDNLRSGVTKACRYEPELNPTYADLARHYGVAVIPARARKPRDKAKVEAGVLLVERWSLAGLRHRLFTSLGELNAAIREQLERLNTRPLRRIQRSRRELFEAWDRPAARALPTTPYEYAEWRYATVNIDYHIAVDHHYYSVPYRFVREKVELRLTASTVEVFHKGLRIAAHPRSVRPHQHTTVAAHMPQAHQRYHEWTPLKYLVESGPPAWTTVTGHHQGGSHAIDHDEGIANLAHRATTSSPHSESASDFALCRRVWIQRCRQAVRLGSQDGPDLAPPLGGQRADGVSPPSSAYTPPTYFRRGRAVDRAGAPRVAVRRHAHPVLVGPGASHPCRGCDDPPGLSRPRLSSDPAHGPATSSAADPVQQRAPRRVRADRCEGGERRRPEMLSIHGSR